MTDKEKGEYVKVIMSLGLDYQMEKITWEHYLKTLELILNILKTNEA